MSYAWQRAHERLLQSLPVRTHWKEAPPEINRFTGKPVAGEELRRRRAEGLRKAREAMRGRVNTFAPEMYARK